MENWYEFTDFISQTEWGFGTAEEADAYCDILNRSSKLGVFSARVMNSDEAEDLDSGRDTDGFRLDDALAEQAELDELQSKREARYHG